MGLFFVSSTWYGGLVDSRLCVPDCCLITSEDLERVWEVLVWVGVWCWCWCWWRGGG